MISFRIESFACFETLAVVYEGLTIEETS